MSWNDIMRRVLQPMKDEAGATYEPHPTSPYGDTDRPPGATNPHRGVDFNYVGGQQSRFNRSHPALRSPVTGVVTNAGEGTMGRIAIRDADGYMHEILHTANRHVSVGDPVVAGQLIGTMGNTGTKQQHVHYQLKDSAGNIINPSRFWDQQGPIESDPPSPAYLNDYLQYQRGLEATKDEASGHAPDAASRYAPQPVRATPPSPTPSGQVGLPSAGSDVRDLRARVASSPTVSGLRINPVGPVPNEEAPADRAPSFSDRFGSWAFSGGASAPLGPYQQFSPPPQSARPLGLVSGEPMPDYPFPPPIFGFSNLSDEAWAGSKRRRADWTGG